MLVIIIVQYTGSCICLALVYQLVPETEVYFFLIQFNSTDPQLCFNS